jgi:predicted AAA+ superfamily ATPase
VVDEVQKAQGWRSRSNGCGRGQARKALKVVLLGSAPLLVQQGLTESLTGRFELLHLPHWSLSEMRAAFEFSVDEYVYSGYPGAGRLRTAIAGGATSSTLVEISISRTSSADPRGQARLLRQLFQSAALLRVLPTRRCQTAHDAGNTTTLAHYLQLLDGAGLLTGLAKFSGRVARQRGSSPKLALNTRW